MSLLRKLVDRFAPARVSTPQIRLAAFGKHPGWNDHMDDLGVSTPELVFARKYLYVDGIGQNISSGAWERLVAAQRLAKFGHEFHWKLGGQLLMGRMWDSRDGKGRGEYPMIVCAQASRLPMGWLADNVVPVLRRLEKNWRQAAEAEQVRASLAEEETGLAASVAQVEAGEAPTEIRTSPYQLLARQPEMGADGQGLLLVLYEIERSSRQVSSQNVAGLQMQLRVPALNNSPDHGCAAWIELLAARLGETPQVLAISPNGERWVDLIVGPPTPQQLVCLLAGESKIPLTTDIPYTLDEDFRSRAAKLIAGGS